MSDLLRPRTAKKRRRIIQGSAAAGGSFLATLYVKPSLIRLGTPAALAVSGPLPIFDVVSEPGPLLFDVVSEPGPLLFDVVFEPGPLRSNPISTITSETSTLDRTPTPSPSGDPSVTSTTGIPERETPTPVSSTTNPTLTPTLMPTSTSTLAPTPSATATPTGSMSLTATATANTTGSPVANQTTGSGSNSSSGTDEAGSDDGSGTGASSRSAQSRPAPRFSSLPHGDEVGTVLGLPGASSDTIPSIWSPRVSSAPVPAAARSPQGTPARSVPSLLPFAGDATSPWLAGFVGGLVLIGAGVRLQLQGRRKAAELARTAPGASEGTELPAGQRHSADLDTPA
jgi:hypothetical protein